jgi:hypothetical protein
MGLLAMALVAGAGACGSDDVGGAGADMAMCAPAHGGECCFTADQLACEVGDTCHALESRCTCPNGQWTCETVVARDMARPIVD